MALSDKHTECAQCGMVCAPNEYHPYAACLMFMACKDGTYVRAKLAEVQKQDTALIRQLVEYIEQNTCQHEETHRGGAIWEICDGCKAQWADDRGGKPKFAWAPIVLAARARRAGKP